MNILIKHVHPEHANLAHLEALVLNYGASRYRTELLPKGVLEHVNVKTISVDTNRVTNKLQGKTITVTLDISANGNIEMTVDHPNVVGYHLTHTTTNTR